MITERIIENTGTRFTNMELLEAPIFFIAICCSIYPITDENTAIKIIASIADTGIFSSVHGCSHITNGIRVMVQNTKL